MFGRSLNFRSWAIIILPLTYSNTEHLINNTKADRIRQSTFVFKTDIAKHWKLQWWICNLELTFFTKFQLWDSKLSKLSTVLVPWIIYLCWNISQTGLWYKEWTKAAALKRTLRPQPSLAAQTSHSPLHRCLAPACPHACSPPEKPFLRLPQM